MIYDYAILAFKNLKRRGLRSWLTMLGIFIGIAAVVALISLGSALQSAITGQFSSQLGSDKLTVQSVQTVAGVPGSSAVTPLTDHDVKVIESVPGVKEVVPRLLRTVKLEFNDKVKYGYATNIPEKQKQTDLVYQIIGVGAQEGRLLSTGERGDIVLGNDYLEKSKDDFGKQITTGSTVKIQGKSFRVVGILKPTGSFMIDSAILMPQKDLEDLFKIDDQYDLIGVQVSDPDNLNEVAQKIEDKMLKDRNEKKGQEDFEVETPQQTLQSVSTIINVINFVVAGIAAISLLIGALGITNTMYTSVLERKREIGVMKSLGAKNSNVLSIFIFESAFLGLVGGIIGAVIGLLIAFGISGIINSIISGLNFKIGLSPLLIFGSIAFALIIGTVAGVLPAIQASKLRPGDALRG